MFRSNPPIVLRPNLDAGHGLPDFSSQMSLPEQREQHDPRSPKTMLKAAMANKNPWKTNIICIELEDHVLEQQIAVDASTIIEDLFLNKNEIKANKNDIILTVLKSHSASGRIGPGASCSCPIPVAPARSSRQA